MNDQMHVEKEEKKYLCFSGNSLVGMHNIWFFLPSDGVKPIDSFQSAFVRRKCSKSISSMKAPREIRKDFIELFILHTLMNASNVVLELSSILVSKKKICLQ